MSFANIFEGVTFRGNPHSAVIDRVCVAMWALSAKLERDRLYADLHQRLIAELDMDASQAMPAFAPSPPGSQVTETPTRIFR